ncbi:MAG TPA: hypothetical protein VMW48_13445 [Vicinamibacterales bacterium]|nr:hypothetical protein [Vicinamibacterales bacterium]
MSKAERIKGQRWEQEVARCMRDCLPGAGVYTGRQSGAYDSVPDIIAGPFAVECKVGARPPSAHSVITQASEHCGDLVPIGVVKHDRRPPYVVIGLADFERIIGDWWVAHGREEEPGPRVIGTTGGTP